MADAELAAVTAELALLEQQQKAQAAIDQKVAEAKALPGEVQAKVTTSVTETVETVRAAPKKAVTSITDTVKATLSSVQSDAKAQLDATRREIEKRKP